MTPLVPASTKVEVEVASTPAVSRAAGEWYGAVGLGGVVVMALAYAGLAGSPTSSSAARPESWGRERVVKRPAVCWPSFVRMHDALGCLGFHQGQTELGSTLANELRYARRGRRGRVVQGPDVEGEFGPNPQLSASKKLL